MRKVLRPFLTCRLCWGITVAVFLLILVVEVAILIPSTRSFELAERARIAERAQIQIDAKLHQADDRPQAALRGVVGKRGVRGVALYDELRMRLAAQGDAPPYPAGELDAKAVAFDDPQGKMTLLSAWRFDGNPVMRVAVRSDAEHVVDDVRAYQWRIAGLVAIIVLVVTAGTMVVVHLGVLRPVLGLRRSSQLAGEDPAAAERYRLPTRRHDEIGQLIDAHNAMLAKISESARFVARHDPLTGLPNRTALTEYLDRESEAAGWRARFGRAPRLAVNLSARQFVEPNLLERSGEIIAQAGVPAEVIEFEVTESAAMRDVTRTAQTLAALRELGVHISIDDFGTGYSSLNYLRRCDLVQGYLYGRPAPAAEFEQLHLADWVPA